MLWDHTDSIFRFHMTTVTGPAVDPGREGGVGRAVDCLCLRVCVCGPGDTEKRKKKGGGGGGGAG